MCHNFWLINACFISVDDCLPLVKVPGHRVSRCLSDSARLMLAVDDLLPFTGLGLDAPCVVQQCTRLVNEQVRNLQAQRHREARPPFG